MIGILVVLLVLSVVGWSASFGIKWAWARFWPESYAATKAKALAELEAEKRAER